MNAYVKYGMNAYDNCTACICEIDLVHPSQLP